MKILYLVGMMILIAACATHPSRCRGALQPINKPAGVASEPRPAKESHP